MVPAVGLSLERRMALLVVLGLAVVFFLFGFLSLRALQESWDRALHERLVAARLTASHIDNFLGLHLTLLAQAAASERPDPYSPDPARERALLDRLRETPGGPGQGALLTDGEGEVVLARPISFRSLLGHEGLQTFARGVAASGRGSVSEGFTDSLGRNLMAVGVPVVGPEGQSAGTLVAIWDLSDPLLGGFVQPVLLGQTGYAEIVDRQGLVLATSRGSRLLQKSDHTDQFADMIRGGRPTVGACHDCHEAAGKALQPDILAFAPLSTAPWGVAIRQSEEEALGPTRELQRSLALASAASLLVAVLVVGLASRAVVWPVQALTAASRRIADGDLAARVESGGPAEIGELARAFDEMRERLRTSLGHLEQVKASLEQRVEQRTRQLSALLGVSKVLASTLDLRQLLDEVVVRTREVLELADAGLVALYNERSGRLEVRANWGYREAVGKISLAPGEGVSGRAFLEGKPVLLNSGEAVREASAALDPENRAWRARAREGLGPAASMMALPLVAGGKATGVMVLEHHRDARTFSPSDLRLAQALADQIAVAVENARLYQEVLEKERLRGQLLEKVIAAQEEERRRIARELHDDTCQSLAALAISLEEAEEDLSEEAAPVRARLAGLKARVRATLAEVRSLALNLRPSVLDDLGLVLAIDWYARDQLARRGLEVNLKLDSGGHKLPPAVETVLFRIAQEALNNVVRHSGAASATVRLSAHDSGIVLEVEDDGRGFDVDRALAPGGPRASMGLHGMIERATISGGVLSVRSSAGHGTIVRAELPLGGSPGVSGGKAREDRDEEHNGAAGGRSQDPAGGPQKPVGEGL